MSHFAPKAYPGFLDRKIIETTPGVVIPNTIGCGVVSPDASARKILELPIAEMLFSHGTTSHFRMVSSSGSNPKDLLEQSYQNHFITKST
jgi:hypothetical protein